MSTFKRHATMLHPFLNEKMDNISQKFSLVQSQKPSNIQNKALISAGLKPLCKISLYKHSPGPNCSDMLG